MRVLVFGAGAVGIYYGLKLHDAGCQLCFVCRSDYESVKQSGFVLHHEDMHVSYKLPIIKHVSDYFSYFSEYPDLILVATKALPHIDLPALLRPVIGSDTVLLLIQNGLGIENALSQAFKNNLLLSTVAFSCLNRTLPGQVRYLGFNRLTIGAFPDAQVPLFAKRLKILFEDQQVAVKLSASMQKERWKKLLWNVPFNGLSVLAGSLTTADLLASTTYVEKIYQIMKEVQVLAEQEGILLEDTLIDANIKETRDKMGAYKTSMLLDYEAGRVLEVDALYGELLSRAKKYHLKLPCIETLYQGLLSV